MTPEPVLVQDRDYYMENGRFVLTAFFLEQRGYCCKNGCRHCPYGFRRKIEQLDPKIESESAEKISVEEKN